MTYHTHYSSIEAFQTKDGSEIRELMHPRSHANAAQSLAEARVAPGETTRMHRHHKSEELYHITHGEGLMMLGDEQFAVQTGDTVVILPGTAHCISNIGTDTLVILCCCSPPYAHEDTELL